MTDILFLGGIFLIAVLYSSVGHGGASGYLAFMALLGFAPEIMRPAALILNIFVSTIAFITFTRNGHLRFKLLWPFMITSIPFAFLGGTFSIDTRIYKIILGIFLLFAIARMLLKVKGTAGATNEINIIYALIIGALSWFFQRPDRYWRRNYSEPDHHTPRVGHCQTDRSGLGRLYPGEFHCRIKRFHFEK